MIKNATVVFNFKKTKNYNAWLKYSLKFSFLFFKRWWFGNKLRCRMEEWYFICIFNYWKEISINDIMKVINEWKNKRLIMTYEMEKWCIFFIFQKVKHDKMHCKLPKIICWCALRFKIKNLVVHFMIRDGIKLSCNAP